jgi:hypothetical protein
MKRKKAPAPKERKHYRYFIICPQEILEINEHNLSFIFKNSSDVPLKIHIRAVK